MKQTNGELESEKTQMVKTEKLLEERVRRLGEERDRGEQARHLRVKTELELKEAELQELRHKLQVAEMD